MKDRVQSGMAPARGATTMIRMCRLAKPSHGSRSPMYRGTRACPCHVSPTIFGTNVATVATRVMIMLAVAGTLAIIAAGLLRPNTPQSTSARSSSIQVGAIAPDFTLSTPVGKQISLSNFRGKPVMLNFWYVTCPGCLAETPGMQKFYVSVQHRCYTNLLLH